jgi:hypothetical protein
VHELSQEFNKDIRGTTFKADLRPIRDSLTDIQGDISGTREALDDDFKRILSEVKKMTEKVKLPVKKRQSDQRVPIEKPIEWVVVKSVSFRLINHLQSREMVQPVHTVARCQCITR